MLGKFEERLRKWKSKRATLSYLNFHNFEYAKAPTLLGKSPDDRNSAVWLAACAIAEQVNYPNSAVPSLILHTELINGLVAMDVANRIRSLHSLFEAPSN